MKPLIVVVKIGGSLINDKSTPVDDIEDLIREPTKFIRFEIFENFAAETKKALAHYKKKNQRVELWLSHGAALYGHQAVDRYGVSKKVREYTDFLNKQITKCLIKNDLPVSSLNAAETVLPVGNKFNVDKMIELGKKIILDGKIPISYGTVVGKNELKIFSADDFLEYVAINLHADHAIVFMDVPLSTEDPKINPDAKMIEKLTSLNQLKITVDSMDKTGGLLEKIKKLQRIRRQTKCRIVNGMVEGNVYKALIGEDIPSEILA